ncbi:GNAT family N-acetyltransferase [Paenibacillus larvae]|uniref:Acetyltransferase n=1 Tax=Paenibacillus larvae subsp. larvae TaxID=147375 RepID=A0A6C0QXZ7_9BACL|nr:GNAT family N-acetyltransferase [Paenibacillus larvae]QHZ53649.1 acetyltransferase [Paenibacillus larvae subsp. larvae]
MSPQDLKESLEMREVKEKHLEQFNDLMNYVFQITNAEINEIGDKYLLNMKKPLLQACDVLGWFDKDKLVSQIMVYPFQVNIHGKLYKMGGLTGVVTYPEYAGKGLIHSLMKEMLFRMKEKGQTLSYLYPYSIPYYRKKGWEIISDVIDYRVKDTQIPKMSQVPGRTMRVVIDHPDKEQVYARFARRTHGAMIRNALAWDERFRWERSDLSVAIYYNPEGQPTGYIYYKVEEETFFATEMIYLDEEARRGLWNFIRAHISMVYDVKGKIFTNEPLAFLLEDGEIEQKISPYYMGRIVDVQGFLEEFPFQRPVRTDPAIKEIVLHLKDPMLDWNNDTFVLSWNDESRLTVTKESGREDGLSMDIQTLTTMMLSYRRPAYLKKVERIKGPVEMVNWLERLIPNEQPWHADYF